MKCSVHFFLINDLFSEELAEREHGGEESEDNRRYQWEDEFAITTPVAEVISHEDMVYPLMGAMPDGTEFREEVGGMRLFELKGTGGNSTWVGCSESLLDEFDLAKLEDEWVLTVFLKDNEPYANPITGIYIASKEFPKSLIA